MSQQGGAWGAAAVLLAAAMTADATIPRARDAAARAATAPAGVPRAWLTNLDQALTVATVEYRPVLALFTSPDCPWCVRLKREVLTEPEIAALLQHYSLVEIDVTEQEDVARSHGIAGVPVLLVLAADGRVRGGIRGYVSAANLKRTLEAYLNPALVVENRPGRDDLLRAAAQTPIASNRWPEVLAALGRDDVRDAIHDAILKADPFPASNVVATLTDPRLAVRLGAVEILEELAGTDFGFDPWEAPGTQPAGENAGALAQWARWSGGVTGAVQAVHATLDTNQVWRLIEDLVSDDRPRSLRAKRVLERGGLTAAQGLADFAASQTHLTAGARSRIREVRFALYLPRTDTIDAVETADRLVFGNLDSRLKTIASLPTIGRRAIPVLRELLGDPDPIVRETVVDALLAADGRYAVPVLAQHLASETERDVIHAAVRGLAKVRTRGSLGLLRPYLRSDDEDLVVAALTSIGKLRSQAAADDIRAALSDRRWRVRAAALEAARELRLTDLADDALARLDDPDEFVRFSAVKTVAVLKPRDAAERLKETFGKYDELKGQVVSAFGALELDLPEPFAAATESAGSEVLLAIIEGLSDCGTRALPLAARLAAHADNDVACSALRLVAARGAGNQEYEPVLTAALRSGDPERQLAVLESLQGSERDMMRYEGLLEYGLGGFEDPDEIVVPPLPSKTGTATPVTTPSAVATSAVDDVFAAFAAPTTTPTTPSVSNVVATQAPPAATSADLFDAFAAPTPAAGSGAAAQAPAGGGSLRDAIAACLDGNADVQFAAALQLTAMQDPRGRPLLTRDLDRQTVKQRVAVALHAAFVPGTNALALLGPLLRDAAPEVRQAAVRVSLSHSPVSVDAAFDAFAATGGVLTAEEVLTAVPSQLSKRPDIRAALLERARQLLDAQPTGARAVLALALTGFCGAASDLPRVEARTASDDPFVRRAARYAQATLAPPRFDADVAAVAKDPSEPVRLVIPAVYTKDRGEWVHYLDGGTLVRRYEYSDMIRSTRHRGLSEPVEGVLRSLCEDVSPKVRIEAYSCLLSHRMNVDLTALARTLDALPDRVTAAERILQFVASNYQQLGPGFQVLLPYFDGSRYDEDTLRSIRKHFNMADEDEAAGVARLTLLPRQTSEGAVEATFAPPAPAPEDRRPARMVFFSSPGCRECERAEALLRRIERDLPEFRLEVLTIRDVRAMRLNEALCQRFGVPPNLRGVTPALFAGGGYFIREELSYDKVGSLLARSAAVRDQDWYPEDEGELTAADAAVVRRFDAVGLGVVIAAGLLDSVNPCAFATIIFFISYLQVTRRTPREIAQVALSFIVGVFLAYFALGLGLIEVIARLSALRLAGIVLNWVMAAVALTLAVLSTRDAILCATGRMQNMTLQLPSLLKAHIHAAVRSGARQARFVAAAFATGVAISVLELACTGQVYLPALHFMLNTRRHVAGATTYLLVYNVAFVLPLVVIFALTYSGLRSETLLRTLRRRAALVKALLAALFLALFLSIFFGALLPDIRSRIAPRAPLTFNP